MKVIIIFDSVYGNTKQIAQTIREVYQNHHEVVLTKATAFENHNLADANMIIIGTPTHGGWYTEEIKKIIDKNGSSFEKIAVATFDTSTPIKNQGFFVNNITKLFGRAAPRLAKRMEKEGAIIIDSKSFIVMGKKGPVREGEISSAKAWAIQLIEKLREIRLKL